MVLVQGGCPKLPQPHPPTHWLNLRFSFSRTKRAGKAVSFLNHLQTCRRQKEMSPGWEMARRKGKGCQLSYRARFLHPSNTLEEGGRGTGCLPSSLSGPQDTGQRGAISKMGSNGCHRRGGEEKQPHQMQRATQHACFPSLAHESRGDRSLISDAKSQELRAAGRYYACTCQCLRAAIKYPSRTWNAKCLQLGRAASTLALLRQTGLVMVGGG